MKTSVLLVFCIGVLYSKLVVSSDDSSAEKERSSLQQLNFKIDALNKLALATAKQSREELEGLRESIMSEVVTRDSQQQEKIKSLMEQNVALTNKLNTFLEGGSAVSKVANGGVTYTRWGRTVCGEDSTVLYTGYAGGSKYNNRGGGSEMLCLHDSPDWVDSSKGTKSAHQSTIYAVEYQLDSGSHFLTSENSGESLWDNNMPCAVCQTKKASSQIMIPGKKTCPKGWQQEYWGFIVSGFDLDQRTSYNCLDASPEAVPGSKADTNPHLVYPVGVMCIGGSYPPSTDGNELTCVVCSQ